MNVIILLTKLTIVVANLKFTLNKYGENEVKQEYGGDLATAAFDIIDGFPSEEIIICYDNNTNYDFVQVLVQKLLANNIAITVFNITLVEVQEKYFDYVGSQIRSHQTTTSIFFATHKLYEHFLLEIYDRGYIRRNVIYIFNWGKQPFKRFFIKNIHNVMKVYVITNPRNDTFRLFYNQAISYKSHHLEMVNWWHQGIGLFNHPTLPPKYNSVYKDFKGKILNIPVIHKPPWHFVSYNNNEVEVMGGRDDRILLLLSKKLNFRYEYFDPPERIQGSSASENGTFKGVLGLIWKREAELFIGDVALTFERANYVEFSFITLADSGAFITHAPSKLNEALALLRPFQLEVWSVIGLTFLIAGPFLYIVIALPNVWQPRFLVRSHIRLLFDCSWFTTTILLRQTGRTPSSSHKARFFIILLSISATYVINDMYSANLTSLLAKPGREKAINNLQQLETAMLTRGYNLYVERHSSSYGLLENGTGIYNSLWRIMNRRQSHFLLESVEHGIKLVRDTTKNAVIAGRETLYFDIQRFGANYFHLSEKLNTAYSAIAFQLGCPYIEEINKILMAIFEAGIITKMTENEYENLGKQKQASSEMETNVLPDSEKENRKISDDNEKLQPISLKMLQGDFYFLCIGNIFSGFILGMEIMFHKHQKRFRKVGRSRRLFWTKIWRRIVFRYRVIRHNLDRIYRRILNEALIATLEYIE